MADSREQTPMGADVEYYCPICEEVFGEDVGECPHDGTKLVRLAGERDDPLIGQRIEGRFTVKEAIGRGGMGKVYRGLQHSVGREVAIKVVSPRLCRERAATKRFLREATLASRLTHANTVTVLDFGQTEDEGLYLVMELLAGRTLKEVLEQEGALSPARSVRIALEVCEALEAAHALDIIHRDLKPSNIMMVDERPERDSLKVLDFGLAKSLVDEDSTTITQSDALIGTPAYLAPDQALGNPVDGRSDLYSLGVILYQMLSGSLPFDGGTMESLLRQHSMERPPPLDTAVPNQLRQIADRLLAKNPEDRYPSAAALRNALLAVDRRSLSSAAPSQASISHRSRGRIELAPTVVQRTPKTGILTDAPNDATAATEPDPMAPGEAGRPIPWKLVLGVIALLGAGALTYSLLPAGAGGAEADAGSVASSGQKPPRTTPDAGARTIASQPRADAGAAEGEAPTFVTITIESDPSGAKLTIDGKRVGRTPHEQEFERSGREIGIELSRRGYHPRRRRIGLRKSGVFTITMKPKRKPSTATELPEKIDAGQSGGGEDFIDP